MGQLISACTVEVKAVFGEECGTDRSNDSAGGRIMGSTSVDGQSSEAAILRSRRSVLSGESNHCHEFGGEEGSLKWSIRNGE